MSDENKNGTGSIGKDLLFRLQAAEENLKTASAALESGKPVAADDRDAEKTIQDVENEVEAEEEDEATITRLDLSSLNLQIAELGKCVDTLKTNLESVQAETKRKNAETDGLLTDNQLRKDMADKTYHFMRVWCSFVGMLIFFYVIKKEFEPPETVIIALMGTTTVSIVGLVGFVVSGLFRSSNKPTNDNKE